MTNTSKVYIIVVIKDPMMRHSIRKQHFRDLMVGGNQGVALRIYLRGEGALPVNDRYPFLKRDTRV